MTIGMTKMMSRLLTIGFDLDIVAQLGFFYSGNFGKTVSLVNKILLSVL